MFATITCTSFFTSVIGLDDVGPTGPEPIWKSLEVKPRKRLIALPVSQVHSSLVVSPLTSHHQRCHPLFRVGTKTIGAFPNFQAKSRSFALHRNPNRDQFLKRTFGCIQGFSIELEFFGIDRFGIDRVVRKGALGGRAR
jgi:hypothetical protein